MPSSGRACRPEERTVRWVTWNHFYLAGANSIRRHAVLLDIRSPEAVEGFFQFRDQLGAVVPHVQTFNFRNRKKIARGGGNEHLLGAFQVLRRQRLLDSREPW